MLLTQAHQALGWPQREQIVTPRGEGPKIYADFTKRKIEAALRRKYPAVEVHTGILAVDPDDDATVAPIAVVCEFPSGAPDEVLDEAHRLAWNFSRTALLITLEPHRLVAWSCCQPPNRDVDERQVCRLEDDRNSQDSARRLLHRVGLVTGNLLRELPERFSSEGRADATLLANLKEVRRRLLAADLPEALCHDLLARVIFTQFLFHRRDRNGRAFFDKPLLESRCGGALKERHEDLASILKSHRETYALFRWLDGRFNGDLFPGKGGQSANDRRRAWRREKKAVTAEHLSLLADLVSGRIDVQRQQLALWPMYSFDVIPLEFISSVYEEFLGEARAGHKAYYTRSHLVDYVLDAVLPWNSDDWNIRVLDPSCGSGIFLVKAFQRLIHRWIRAHHRPPRVSDLKPILTNNIVGVDRHPEAVRVACFSLYLAMADAIDPRYYLKRDKVFPRLRETSLLATDFFDESTPGIRTEADAGTYDLVLGNAPWGDGTVRTSSFRAPSQGKAATRKKEPPTLAQAWAKKHHWPVVNRDLGPLFLAKGAALVQEDGYVAMIQSASLLNLRSKDAPKLREKLFGDFTFDEITNLSILRDELFVGVSGSCVAMVFRRAKPDPEQTMLYICPKPIYDPQSQHRFAIDPHDVHRVTHAEAIKFSWVWSALLIGGQHEFGLLLRLSKYPTLAKLEEKNEVNTRQGVIPGDRLRVLDGHTETYKRGSKQAEVHLPDLRDAHYFDEDRFPDGVLHLDQNDVPIWGDPRTHSDHSTDFGAFRTPQLLIKSAYSRKDGRWRAVRVRATKPPWGVICKKTYLSVCDLKGNEKRLDAACVVFNSKIATWYLALTSGRLGHNRPEPLVAELRDVPLPPADVDLNTLKSTNEIDACAAKMFGLTETDMLFVDDCVARTLPQAQSESMLSGYLRTLRSGDTADDEPEPGLVEYANCVLEVLRATFGARRRMSATVYEEQGPERLPVRMVGLHLDAATDTPASMEAMAADGLMNDLQRFHEQTLAIRARGGGPSALGMQRVAFLFDQGSNMAKLSVYIVKPDQRRYWTQPLAIHDADHLSGAMLTSAQRGTEGKSA